MLGASPISLIFGAAGLLTLGSMGCSQPLECTIAKPCHETADRPAPTSLTVENSTVHEGENLRLTCGGCSDEVVFGFTGELRTYDDKAPFETPPAQGRKLPDGGFEVQSSFDELGAKSCLLLRNQARGPCESARFEGKLCARNIVHTGTAKAKFSKMHCVDVQLLQSI